MERASEGGPGLSDVEERRIGELTVRIDRLLCVGFGDCIEAAPAAFAFDEEGIATLLDGAVETDASSLVEACRTYPVDALEVLDPEGRKLAP